MSVNHVSGVGRVVLPATTSRTADQASTQPEAQARTPGRSTAVSLVEIDENTQQPIPPRFPWLSRLARELEPASKQPSPYGTVPILGEKLDKQA
jgi:hypothetical protein